MGDAIQGRPALIIPEGDALAPARHYREEHTASTGMVWHGLQHNGRSQ